MPLQKFIFRPGINREGTAYSNEGGWFNSNRVRFRNGLPEKIGGWSKNSINSFQSTGRALHAWVETSGTKYLGLGTTWKYYVLDGNVYNDITPIRATTTNGIVFAATDGSTTITATDSSHGAIVGDFVTISGAASLGGNITAAVLNTEHQIVGVPTANTYTFVASATASSDDSGNGGSGVDGSYQINIGLDVYVQSTGWGAGTWGAGTWGSTSALTANNQLRLWSHDNFGEDLLINVRAGGIYYWDESEGTDDRAVPLTALSGANLTPTVALQVLVSDVDRHIICFGADPITNSARTGAVDPLFIAWSDQENAAEWEPKSTNTAGSFRLSAGSVIIGAIRARQETLIGPNAMINTPKGVFWMDKKGFYSYTGQVAELPCTVTSYVFNDLNQGQSHQVFGFVNKAFDEVGWFYCSGSSTVIDKYVTYNYEEQVWMIGELSRTCWLDEGIFSDPKATASSSDVGYIYNHETGNDDDGLAMTNVFIESSDFDIDPAGEDFQFVSKIIPDIRFTGTADTGSEGQEVDLVLKRRNFPGESLTTAVTTACTSVTTKIDTRVRGRQAVLRIQSNDDDTSKVGVGFRVGAMRLDSKPDGRR